MAREIPDMTGVSYLFYDSRLTQYRMVETEHFNAILGALLSIIIILSTTLGVFKWKANQIANDAARRTNTKNDTQENHKDINQLKEIIISLQSKIAELCDRISRMEGAFNQHNREKGNT